MRGSRIALAFAPCLLAGFASAQFPIDSTTTASPTVTSTTNFTFNPVPSGNSVYIGAWIDTSDAANDTIAAINNRMGLNFPIHQLAQSIPLPPYDYDTGTGGQALYSYLAVSGTDAAFVLTIYADQIGNMALIQDSDLASMATQCAFYASQGRTVFLRFLPEMGGAWQPYGLQPTLFKQVWLRMYQIVKAIAPNTIVMWSPNSSYGYPSGTTLDDVASLEDRIALDTNHDGVLTSDDDAFSPYYPGDAYLDWAGVSVYYKGPGFRDLNEPQPGGYVANVLVGHDPFYLVNYTDFYDTYCAFPQRNCMLAESGAAYHVNVTSGSTQLEMQQAWWEDCLLNNTFLDLYPQIKVIMMFEHAKNEFDGGIEDFRDYRITWDATVVAAFQKAAALFPRAIWGTSTYTGNDEAVPLVPTTPPISPGAKATSTITTVVPFETITFTETSFSAAFYDFSQSSSAPSPFVAQGVIQAASSSADRSTCAIALIGIVFTLLAALP